ncbi:helicase [Capsaspora owczarzaki ATCC 30864]|uniref:DNA 3'-5' helicase n=1 Tax=Capsaspora owczarzaki (strain ATCC 30864) TaxID=595528 RepID=A0A0D2W0V7_CAPO3|nr:helicase [Capsaspora owczarzaki ATCC 30864]KJE97887.1 helicase [Capsaspora owczarzaki ATCC 30864]|eukprot:XP_004343054.1 helicase [Capsaspora owczarzaki ATCC 30864]
MALRVAPKCPGCGKMAVLLVAGSTSANNFGREYYGCPSSCQGLRFIGWADRYSALSMSTGAAGAALRTTAFQTRVKSYFAPQPGSTNAFSKSRPASNSSTSSSSSSAAATTSSSGVHTLGRFATRSSIMELPPELLCAIFAYLSVRDIQAVGQTCRRFHDVIAYPGYLPWRKRFWRDRCSWLEESSASSRLPDRLKTAASPATKTPSPPDSPPPPPPPQILAAHPSAAADEDLPSVPKSNLLAQGVDVSSDSEDESVVGSGARRTLRGSRGRLHHGGATTGGFSSSRSLSLSRSKNPQFPNAADVKPSGLGGAPNPRLKQARIHDMFQRTATSSSLGDTPGTSSSMATTDSSMSLAAGSDLSSILDSNNSQTAAASADPLTAAACDRPNPVPGLSSAAYLFKRERMEGSASTAPSHQLLCSLDSLKPLLSFYTTFRQHPREAYESLWAALLRPEFAVIHASLAWLARLNLIDSPRTARLKQKLSDSSLPADAAPTNRANHEPPPQNTFHLLATALLFLAESFQTTDALLRAALPVVGYQDLSEFIYSLLVILGQEPWCVLFDMGPLWHALRKSMYYLDALAIPDLFCTDTLAVNPTTSSSSSSSSAAPHHNHHHQQQAPPPPLSHPSHHVANRRLTSEQHAIVACNLAPSQVMKIVAFAGTGKTSTLIAYTMARRHQRFLYLTFNNAMAAEARKVFPETTVLCKTAHSVAYERIVERGKYSAAKLNGQNLKHSAVAEVIAPFLQPNYPPKMVSLTIDVLMRFLHSADRTIGEKHISYHVHEHHRKHSETFADFPTSLYPRLASELWSAVRDPNDLRVTLVPDAYLKLLQLSTDQHLAFDCILVDEAQDSNPAVISLVMRQQGCAKIFVGDDYQQIYKWRGAVNALARIEPQYTFALTRSFRFGFPVADVANSLLQVFRRESRPVLGMSKVPQVIGENVISLHEPHCVIARTNKQIFAEAALLAGLLPPHLKVGFVGSTGAKVGDDKFLTRLTNVARLHDGLRSEITDRKIAGFQNFESLKEHAENTDDTTLSTIIGIVEQFSPDVQGMVDTIRTRITPDSDKAHVVLTTVHAAKGLEFDCVRLSDDFTNLLDDNESVPDRFPNNDEDDATSDFDDNQAPPGAHRNGPNSASASALPRKRSILHGLVTPQPKIFEEINLIYVAVTRAKRKLQLSANLASFMAHCAGGERRVLHCSSMKHLNEPTRCFCGSTSRTFMVTPTAVAEMQGSLNRQQQQLHDDDEDVMELDHPLGAERLPGDNPLLLGGLPGAAASIPLPAGGRVDMTTSSACLQCASTFRLAPTLARYLLEQCSP